MLTKEVGYTWLCDTCGNVETKRFTVLPHESFPILRDPPKGWMLYNGPKGEEHRCPKCGNDIRVAMEKAKQEFGDKLLKMI